MQAKPFHPPQGLEPLRLSPHPLLDNPALRLLPRDTSPDPALSTPLTPTATLVEEHSPFPSILPEVAHVRRSARHRTSVPTWLDPSTSPTRRMIVTRRRPLPPSPDSRPLVRTPDVYVAASLLNRNATAKQRGRRGFREPIVDAGWSLCLARDMKKNAVVLDYRFVDGRGGVEVDRLDADQLKRRYSDPLQPATHVLQVWGSGFYWDTLWCNGVGGFANSCVGQQNCLFRGSKIHVGKTGCGADTEVLVSYSSSNSYQWARDPTPTDDFHARRSTPTPARARVASPWAAAQPTAARPPTTASYRAPHSTPSLKSLPEPSMRLRRRITSNRTQPPSDSSEPPQPPPVHRPRSARDPPATPHQPSLPPLTEERRDADPPFRPPTEADLEPTPTPSVVAAVRTGTSPSTGVICFQRSLPGALSPEILVHVTFDALSNRGAGTSSFSGLPLGPPSVNGWSARGVTNSLRVEIT